MTTERKLFTAEIKRLQARGEATPNASNSEVLKAINELRGDIKGLEALVRGEAPAPVAAVPADDVLPQKAAEVSMLKTELRALAVCIEHTKAEIAALRPKDADDDRLIAVTFELDAIVSSTEQATEQILEAAEKIESTGREILAHAADSYVGRLVEDINDTISTIFEACNFQDITGQRITKVVKTLKYVEDRINAMIEIWGPENISDVSPKIFEEHKDDDSKLLNGPALENQGISQDEIDKLFG
ncbi:Chemotaxis protein [Paramagnetospirillum magnetotacticum MS-1]|uniref:Chemotaxis protein n=1 Tax=Paramagnetospirillum magnetotacticum MS-1 TaxID=272627 RepID=A0A0C2YQ47_PARME|nr:protein phosphatase CheZ [Paramagnetospirillum magnetotacticum]KIL96790.1 Chemotaxis protein [Paramagnetospirillum magnetotacticum MS-1]